MNYLCINDSSYLVRTDHIGVIHYSGRKDHQVKLQGQRIELGEVERCLLDVSSEISNCVVVKWDNQHLIGYVQSDPVTSQQLRKYCRSRLSLFMIPLTFIVLKQLPLNPNGKVDRKSLAKLFLNQ